jgi:hypothetical protein
VKGDIRDIIREKKTALSIQWIPIADKNLSYADPFIVNGTDGNVQVLYEQMTSYKMDGHIGLLVFDKAFSILEQRKILDTGSHLSYPFIFRENGQTFIFPENALGGALNCYEYDEKNKTLINPINVLDLPVLDSTILKYDGRYWLFCTLLGDQLNSELHIFYSDQLKGSYTPHPANPVKTGLKGSRPAGDFIEVDGAFYRPAQNCTHYYGESVTIYKLKTLDKAKFEEEFYMEIKPNSGDEFNYGLHTLNARDNYIIVDGQKSHFQPFQQLARKFRNLVVKT